MYSVINKIEKKTKSFGTSSDTKINIKNLITKKNGCNCKLDNNIKSIKTDNIVLGEVIDEDTYKHFKMLLKATPKLCYGKTHKNDKYKVHIALSKDFKTLLKQNFYTIKYYHNNKQILAFISVKHIKKDGNYLFVHKLCSLGGGYGTNLMNLLLTEAKNKVDILKITYLSLTTHNLDLIDYYNKFSPTRVVIVDNPGSKAKIKKRVAYMIWQLSPNMPYLNYDTSTSSSTT